jgi:DNA-binding CsgD family transcriptional regulator
VFVLSGSGRVLYSNRAAQTLLDLQDGLKLRDRHLCATDPLVQWKLQGLIASAPITRRPRLPGDAGTVGVPRPSGKRSFQLRVLPLPARGVLGRARTLVLVGDPDGAANVPHDTLAALYALTPAEVQIGNALLAGQSISEIARRREVAIGTVRMQIKSIFRKTKTHRQSELVKLLLSLPGLPSDDK